MDLCEGKAVSVAVYALHSLGEEVRKDSLPY